MLRIKITVRGSDLTATLIDSPTSRDFISLLPLTLTMNDLFGREKFGHLPRAITEGGASEADFAQRSRQSQRRPAIGPGAGDRRHFRFPLAPFGVILCPASFAAASSPSLGTQGFPVVFRLQRVYPDCCSIPRGTSF